MKNAKPCYIDFSSDSRDLLLKKVIAAKRRGDNPIAQNYEGIPWLKQINDTYLYLVEDGGKYAINLYNGFIKLSTEHQDGYHSFTLYNSKNKKMEKRYSHVCVALAFIKKVKGKPEVDHIDRNRSNNDITNLRWANRVEQLKNRTKF